MLRVQWCAALGLAAAGLVANGGGLSAQTPATASPGGVPATLTIVFDGSGSMWGKIEGDRQAKFAVAREAIRKMLPALNPETRVGLASFGHRRPGDCSDVQVLQTPEKVDAEKINGQLERLNPKGKGPVVAGLKEAAKSLAGVQGPRSLILIHDDPDNCQQDICAAASEIAAAQPGVPIHVVALGLRKEDVQRMSCVATATKGKIFDAQNAAQATSAIEDALKLASADAGMPDAPPVPAAAAPQPVLQVPVPRPAIRPATVQVPARPPVLTGPPALHLRATLAANGAAVVHPVHWIVRRADAAQNAPRAGEPPAAPLFAKFAETAVADVPPGAYEVEVRDGLVRQTKTVTLTDRAPLDVELIMNAGIIRPYAVAQKSGKAIDGAVFTLREAAAAASGGAPKVLTTLAGANPQAMLAAGTYLLGAEHGAVRSDRAVQVAAGSDADVEFVLASATLKLEVAGRDGADGGAALFIVYEDDPDSPRGRREVARSAARSPEFVLPAGVYSIVTRIGAVESRERATLAPGDRQQRQITQQTARVQLLSRFAGTAQAIGENVSYRIERLDAATPEVTHVSQAAPTVDLAPGTYRIESRLGLLNAKATRDVTIAAGRGTDAVFEHQAGTVNLRLATGASGEVHWDVKDSTGRTVWISGKPAPALLLQAGRYTVRGETREKRYQRAFEVKTGAAQTVELTD